MCVLENKINKKSVTGYKFILKNKRTGKYYSAAMGFEYKEDEDIPKIRVQKRIGDYWSRCILDVYGALFKRTMVGRTSCFKYLKDIKKWANGCKPWNATKNFVFVILKVELTKDLMAGCYSDEFPVYAGRRIKFLKEMKF